MPRIISTLTTGQTYVNHAPQGDGTVRPVFAIDINGGNGLTNLNGILVQGAETEVTNEQVEQLKQNAVFNLHVKNGFVTVYDGKQDKEVPLADLNQRDESAPFTPADVEELYETGEITVPLEEYVPDNAKKRRA
jgi:hypothetical protein